MNNSSITDRIRTKYIDEYLESAKKINYTELNEDHGLIKVLYKDLPKTELNGYPVASDFVAPDGTAYSVVDLDKLSEDEKKKLELRYYYLPKMHELYVGTTGSGKTTGCVEPQLRAISTQKNKPNIFLTDPKGELFERNAAHLRAQGYQLYVLNFKDPQFSDTWNPLHEIYDTQMEILNIGKEVKMHTGDVNKSNLQIIGKNDNFSADGYLEYDGKAFQNGNDLDDYIAVQTDFLTSQIDSLINQMATMMISVQAQDKSWEYGAQDLLKGLLNCMLEDAVEDPLFTRSMMNFSTLQQYYIKLRRDILPHRYDLRDHPLTKNKKISTISLMTTALDNADGTMKSYCGVFNGAIKDWFQAHIFALTCDSTIEIDNDEKPFAIFLITRDYEKSDFYIAGLFVDWLYRQMLDRAETNKSTRALHFLLDEFGNIPAIKNFENKISTSRSRNIWFHLYVQSYKQIDAVYSTDTSVIIRDNCNAQVFLGAQNRESKEIFSRECGTHCIPTLSSKLNAQDNTITTVPLIPISDLDMIKPGQMYIRRLYMPVVTSQYIRSYVCANYGAYKDFDSGSKFMPYSGKSYSSDKYLYGKLRCQQSNPSFFECQ